MLSFHQGANVMILKIFWPKYLAAKLAFLNQSTALFMFSRKTPIFSLKIGKNRRN
jgi:hypothetical protein